MPPAGKDNADCPNPLIFNTVRDKRRESAEWSGPGLNWRHTDFQSENKPRKPREKRGPLATCQQIASSRAEMPPDLQTVIDAWPSLPAAIQAGILAMVKATGGKT